MTVADTYRVRARNTAPDSENRIHDDQTAAAYGFRAGLVPGVTVYGYLTVPVIDRFGEDWLARGGMRVRFLEPVYDGEDVVVTLTGNAVSASQQDGTACAAGDVFWPEDAPPSLAQYPDGPLPAVRPAASAESLAPGRTLGTVYTELPLPDPAALLTLSNHFLMQNVVLGPWIHASSEVRHFSLARAGDRVAVRGRVAERFERKGHQFVVLDIIVVADAARIVQHVRHTAIYELRPPAGR
jgi:acyl dehydratase